jgi:hypothetical protein
MSMTTSRHRFPVAAYAARLDEERRDRFARFASLVPHDALTDFLRSQGGAGSLRAAPGWHYR